MNEERRDIFNWVPKIKYKLGFIFGMCYEYKYIDGFEEKTFRFTPEKGRLEKRL